MHRMMKAYIYGDSTVVIDKTVINNASDEDFREVSLIISAEEIEQFYDELQTIREQEEREESA